ncbi:MAG: tRNA pseudouridine(55) synthase TruB [Rikenellaceae bacterium]|jgi:tRNA pseudouridine55 synthase|nr:tRNA pseudouridine(55) synthase TruB [Rikenellaceae bacterium]
MQQEPLSSQLNFPEGYVLNVDKPLGWTSTDVVRKIKYTLEKLGFRRIKVGHAGTLDPLASGVLVVCIGKATKRAEELMCERKEYVAEVMLGASTVSHDLEHPVSALFPWEHITREAVEQALRDLSGERLQTPPVYSAKRMEGKRAYEYAREGEQVEMRQALINIYGMELVECELPRIKIRVECSKGTYIRSLAHEIGERLASDGYLASLRRTQSGDFRAEEAMELKKIVEILSATKQS